VTRQSELPPLYNPAFEHDGCGTGFVASIDGEASHRVVELAVRALVGLTHRGAVSADAASGDGAGLTIQIPLALLADDAEYWGLRPNELDRLGVAMVFLPTEASARPRARKLLEASAQGSGLDVLGWRTVPVDPSMLGGVALESLPGIEQLLLAKAPDLSGIEFERLLYLARRRAEAAYREHDVDAYIVSMSARTIVYKGLMVAPRLRSFSRTWRTRAPGPHWRCSTSGLPPTRCPIGSLPSPSDSSRTTARSTRFSETATGCPRESPSSPPPSGARRYRT